MGVAEAACWPESRRSKGSEARYKPHALLDPKWAKTSSITHIASCCKAINGPWQAVRSGSIVSTMAREPGMTTAEFSKPGSEAEDKASEGLRVAGPASGPFKAAAVSQG